MFSSRESVRPRVSQEKIPINSTWAIFLQQFVFWFEIGLNLY